MESTTRERKAVEFAAKPDIRLVPAKQRSRKSTLNMDDKLFETFASNEVTNEMVEQAAKLFSENYGVWGDHTEQTLAKPGSRVRLSPQRLRSQYLLPEVSSYVRVTVNGQLAGHCFTSRWQAEGKTVCWITQLVVHSDYRERGLAWGLLNQVRQDADDVYGIMSSHPAACLASAKAFGSSINMVSLDYMKENAERVMKASPVRYVRDARLRGSLFDDDNDSGLVSSVDTGFYVDHEEPLEALDCVRETMEWPLGELIDGHEFILVIQAKRRARSRLSSSRKIAGSAQGGDA